MWSDPDTYPCQVKGTQEMRGGLAIGKHADLARTHVVARTEVTAIIGFLSFWTKSSEASRPRCRGGFDLSVVRIDMTRPFPLIKVVWNVVFLRHSGALVWVQRVTASIWNMG